MGGVLVDPAHNLHYVDGSLSWAGIMPMAIIGVSRAFHIDLTPYLSEYGKPLYAKLEKASIVNVLAQYPGLTWAQLAKPEYPTPESIPVYVHTVNQLIMGTGGTPTIAAADRPGRPRRAGRDGGQQAGDRRGRRRDDRRRRPQPGAPVLRQRRRRSSTASTRSATSAPRCPGSPSDDLDEQPLPRPPRAIELREHRTRQPARPDRRIAADVDGPTARQPALNVVASASTWAFQSAFASRQPSSVRVRFQ